ncbi:hypothetical protein BHM03_00057346, partial [Ensete ventricosum]
KIKKIEKEVKSLLRRHRLLLFSLSEVTRRRGGGDVAEASPHLQHSTREGSVGSGSSRGGRAGSGREVLPLLLPLSLSLFFSLTAARLILPDKAVTVKIDRYRPVSGGNGAETTLINGIIR